MIAYLLSPTLLYRRDLESYIQSVFQFLQRAIPPIMATFLHMDRYDVNFLLQELSAKCFDREVAPERESPANEESWTPLEMFAISTRLKSPLPPLDSASRRTVKLFVERDPIKKHIK